MGRTLRQIVRLANLWIGVVCGILSTGCQKDIDKINIDITSARTIEIVPDQIVRLEISDSSLLYGIDNLFHLNGHYIVHSRQYVRSFRDTNGKFEGNIAQKGTHEMDFSDVSNIWHEGDTLAIFDSNRLTIQRYLCDGQFIEAEKPFSDTQIADGEHPRKYFCDTHRNVVLTLNGSSGGSTPSNPLVTVYDCNHRRIKPFSERQVQESSYLMDGTFYDNADGRLLIWMPFRDTIFVADGIELSPLCVVDFGANSFPAEFQRLPDMTLRAKAFNSSHNSIYASLLRYVQKDDNDIYFSFKTNDDKTYIARHNINDGTTALCFLNDSSGRYRARTFFLLDGDSIRMELIDTQDIEANPAIYSISKKF